MGRGVKFKVSDFPEHVQAQLRAQLGPEKPKRPKRTMTKVEREYGVHLESLKQFGRITEYRYEPLRLVLAEKTTYQPDYLIVLPLGRVANGAGLQVHFHEVKGRKSNGKAYWKEDARLKIKLAAEAFDGIFKFEAVWPDGDGGWNHETFNGRPK